MHDRLLCLGFVIIGNCMCSSYRSFTEKRKVICTLSFEEFYYLQSYLQTLEMENNGYFTNDIFWLYVKVQNNHKHLNYRQKDVWKIGIYFTLMCFTILQPQNTNIKYVHQLESI